MKIFLYFIYGSLNMFIRKYFEFFFSTHVLIYYAFIMRDNPPAVYAIYLALYFNKKLILKFVKNERNAKYVFFSRIN